jgi:hypothetical protein
MQQTHRLSSKWEGTLVPTRFFSRHRGLPVTLGPSASLFAIRAAQELNLFFIRYICTTCIWSCQYVSRYLYWPARNKHTCTCPALWLLARFIALDLMAGSFTFAHSPQWRRSATGDGQPSSPAPSSPLECLILGMIYSTVHIYL